MSLNTQDIINLKWMKRANARGVGLFGPTIRRHGLVAECERLREPGLCAVVNQRRSGDKNGYWLTEAGEAVLAHMTPAISFDVRRGNVDG